MTTNKIYPGEVQKAWINNLYNNGHRQTRNKLGHQIDGRENYKACIMGELLMTYCRYHSLPLPYDEKGHIISRNGCFKILSEWEELGFCSSFGHFKVPIVFAKKTYYTLVGLNDGGITWPEIAHLIEENPSNLFTKSV